MKLFADSGSAALTSRNPASILVATALRTASKVAAPVRAYLQREAVYRELTGLDDRMLADIGLNRADLYAVKNGLRRADTPAAPRRGA